MYLNPIYIHKYFIYDIFHNGEDIIIITPMEYYPPYKILLDQEDEINKKHFDVIIDTDNHTFVYKIKADYKNKIQIIINGEIIITNINIYPTLNNKILMSTIVKDEDEYIIQWINYNLKLGINNFIIYDNSANNTLDILLKDYIKSEKVILIKWTYTYLMEKSGFSAQTTQQNHSLYVFKNAKYIGMFDIDEYVNPQNNYLNIDTFLDDYIKKNNIDINSIGSFRLLNKFFYNPYNLSTKNYDFLKIYNCDSITYNGREKNFVIPKNVNMFAVHKICIGKPMHTINADIIYFNHYFFLNKGNRGKNLTKFTDDSIDNKFSAFDL